MLCASQCILLLLPCKCLTDKIPRLVLESRAGAMQPIVWFSIHFLNGKMVCLETEKTEFCPLCPSPELKWSTWTGGVVEAAGGTHQGS